MADMKDCSQPEEETRFRSRPRKPFYKKWGFGVLVIFILLSGAIGTNILMNDKKVENLEQPTKKETKKIVEESEKAVEESLYTYEDFKGTYVLFEGTPYDSLILGMSNIIVLREDSYQTFNRWDYDMTSIILNKNIKDNILTINLDSADSEVWGRHSETGIEQFKLLRDGNKKVLYSINDDKSFYSMSIEDLQAEYNQLEIDYARILMTLLGEPSLDQWALWNAESGVLPIVEVSHSAAGNPTVISDSVIYPENVTHLSLTNQMMDDEMITYSTQGDGYIKVYPMPLHYHQENQSEEDHIEIAKQAIDDAYKIYVEPFEPYSVADFIGQVKFVYQ